MSISRFQQTDRDGVLRLHEATFRQMDLSRSLWEPCQQIESLEKDCFKLVYKEERGVGYAAAYRLQRDSFRLNLLVHPENTRRGIGSLLVGDIEAGVRREGGRQLEARLLEGMDESLAFALRRGFIEVHRMRGVSLSAEDFSFEKWKL